MKRVAFSHALFLSTGHEKSRVINQHACSEGCLRKKPPGGALFNTVPVKRSHERGGGGSTKDQLKEQRWIIGFNVSHSTHDVLPNASRLIAGGRVLTTFRQNQQGPVTPLFSTPGRGPFEATLEPVILKSRIISAIKIRHKDMILRFGRQSPRKKIFQNSRLRTAYARRAYFLFQDCPNHSITVHVRRSTTRKVVHTTMEEHNA